MDKDHILSEIKRTAEANGGKALGKIRFLDETGIKESDWYGKYWNTWGDAVVEAGYKPNKLNAALDDDYILDKFVELILDLDRYPVKGDLLMRARANQDFPSHNTFQRFGPKARLAHTIIEKYKSHENYERLKDICLPISKKEKQIKEGSVAGKKGAGYVYLIQFGREYKIGNSNNVERRFRQLKTQMPYDGKVIHTIETGDPEGIEAYWHTFFSDKRLKGEWFELTSEDIRYFTKRKLM